MLSVSYGTTLGTQLQLVQNQLNLATAGTAGNLVNAQTGGVLFGPSGAFAVQDGVFRTRSLVVGSQTSLDRDIISLNAIYAVQSNTGAGNNLSTTSTTASASWVHQMRPDMTLSAAVSLSWQNQPSSVGLVPDSSLVSGTVPGNSLLGIGSLTWQYQISETITTSVRYSLLNRHSAVAGYSMLQNIFILGLTKTF
jgi:hypothetical protein